jgi:serine/threonine protein kinase
VIFSEEDASLLAKALTIMVNELHASGVMHRDLKPDNILLVDKNDFSSVRGADFSHSTFFNPGIVFAQPLFQNCIFLLCCSIFNIEIHLFFFKITFV